MKKRHLFATVAAVALVVAACGGSGKQATPSGSGSASPSAEPTGPVTLTFWHGYTDVEADSLKALLNEWNAQNPNIHIKPLYFNNDNALQKLTVALQGGTPPDITYQYGSSMAQLASAPKLVDLTKWVQQPDVNWNDFIPGARAAATVGGKVLGIPALMDNLALVYNKSLFDAAGLSYPTDQWTWDDFRAAAKALTNPAKKQFGFSYPMDASEDTVWHYDPLLWQDGGSILNADNTKAAFNSPQGVQALQVLTSMAVQDKSVYLDIQNSNYTNLFNSGRIGMLVTGPWDLSSFPDVKYGVSVLPGFNGDHQTIAGPDMWCVFDNGGERAQAALKFLAWLTAPAQIEKDALKAGHLPFRLSVVNDTAFVQQFGAAFRGIDAFVQNLTNVKQARPVLAAYPQVSEAMGNAIVAAMLGKSDPKSALDGAAEQADQALSLSG